MIQFNSTDWDFLMIIAPRDLASGMAAGKRLG
jgi:hypothetical protein